MPSWIGRRLPAWLLRQRRHVLRHVAGVHPTRPLRHAVQTGAHARLVRLVLGPRRRPLPAQHLQRAAWRVERAQRRFPRRRDQHGVGVDDGARRSTVEWGGQQAGRRWPGGAVDGRVQHCERRGGGGAGGGEAEGRRGDDSGGGDRAGRWYAAGECYRFVRRPRRVQCRGGRRSDRAAVRPPARLHVSVTPPTCTESRGQAKRSSSSPPACSTSCVSAVDV